MYNTRLFKLLWKIIFCVQYIILCVYVFITIDLYGKIRRSLGSLIRRRRLEGTAPPPPTTNAPTTVYVTDTRRGDFLGTPHAS